MPSWAGRALGLAGTLIIPLCAIGGAAAQQPSQAQAAAIRANCRSDYMAHCSGVPTGGKAALQCLQEHVADLSQPCQAALRTAETNAARPPISAPQPAPPAHQLSMREEASLMRTSCGGDFRAWCHGVSPGGGRALSCLEANESRLSPSCKGALAEARAGR